MATAKKGFGLPCPPPEDDDMGFIDMRTKSRAKPRRNQNRFYFIPQVVLNQKENGLSYKTRLHHQLQSKATGKVYHKRIGKLVDEMDELSEQIISLNVSADDRDVSADEEFPFLSDSDSYDLYDDISLKNYDGLLVHKESSDFIDLASDDEEEGQMESDQSRKFLKDNNSNWEPLYARTRKNARGSIFNQGQSTTQDSSSLSQMANSHGNIDRIDCNSKPPPRRIMVVDLVDDSGDDLDCSIIEVDEDIRAYGTNPLDVANQRGEGFSEK